MRFSPGCNCCGILCDLYDGDFVLSNGTNIGADWTEVSGNWTIASNNAHLPNNTTNAVATNSGIAVGSDFKITTQVKAPTTSSNRARIIVGYVDANNYHFAELVLSGATSIVRLHKRAAGVVTTLAESSTGFTTAANTYCVFTLCLRNDDTLIARCQTTGGVHLQGCAALLATPITSSVVGVGGTTAALSTNALDFVDFAVGVYGAAAIDSETCGGCAVCRRCSGQIPEAFIAEIYGGATPTIPPADYPGGHAHNFAGQYVCDYIGSLAGSGVSNFCLWRYFLQAVGTGPFINHWRFYYIEVFMFASGPDTTVQTTIAFGHDVSGNVTQTYFQDYTGAAINCMGIADTFYTPSSPSRPVTITASA